jgi:hypothetical protein
MEREISRQYFGRVAHTQRIDLGMEMRVAGVVEVVKYKNLLQPAKFAKIDRIVNS